VVIGGACIVMKLYRQVVCIQMRRTKCQCPCDYMLGMQVISVMLYIKKDADAVGACSCPPVQFSA
jgi:hypothetical protein